MLRAGSRAWKLLPRKQPVASPRSATVLRQSLHAGKGRKVVHITSSHLSFGPRPTLHICSYEQKSAPNFLKAAARCVP